MFTVIQELHERFFFLKKGEETCESPVCSSTEEAHRSEGCNGHVNDGPRNEGHQDIGKNIGFVMCIVT